MAELTHLSSGPLKTLNPKRALENISGISLDCVVKQKRRKISAIRDFPRCCRRKALEINGKPSGENSTLGAVGAVLVDSELSNSTNLGERSSKSVVDVMTLVESSNGHKPIDSLTTSKESVPEAELLKGSDKKDLLDHLGTMQSKVTELSTTKLGDASNSKCLDQCVLPNASQSTNRLVLMAMSSGLDQQESVVSQKVTVQSIEAKEENASGFHQPALCATASTNQSKVDMSGSLEQIASIQSEKDSLQMLDLRTPALQSANENVPRKIPGRRFSCHRDFPPGCGRNVPSLPKKGLEETIALTGKILTEESCSIEMDGILNVKDVVSKSERGITKETKREVHVESALENDTVGDETEGNENNVKFRESSGKNLEVEDSKRNEIGATHQSKSREPDMCSKSKGHKTNKVVGRPVKKLGNESMQFHKDKKSERKFMSETDNEGANVSKSVGEVSVDLGYSSNKTILHGNVAGDREKKEKPVMSHSCNSVCRKKDDNGSSLSAESPDGNLRNEGKLPEVGKIASWHKNEQAIKDEVDSLPHEDVKDVVSKSERSITKETNQEVHVESALENDTVGDETEGNENNVKFRESSSKNLEVEDSKRNEIGATRQSKSREPDMCSKSTGHKTNQVVGRPVKKLGNESMEFHKDKKSERKFMSETDNDGANVSKSVGEVSVDLGYSSNKTILRGNVAGDREKKEKPVVSHSYNSVCRKKDDNGSSLHAESPDGNLRNEEQAIKDEVDSLPHEDDKDFEVPRGQEMTVSMIPFVRNQSAIIADCGKTARQKVRETLRLFQAICRKLLWQEETKLNQQVQTLGRIAMLASMLLKERNKWVNTGKPIIGNVPGIEVGDEFHYRVELAIVGLHCPFQSGIDFTKQGETFLATSVVASGRYANEDYSDVLVYSGQGGQPVGGIKKAEDQKLTRGNLALKNCIDTKTLVRVIRGYKEPRINHSQAGRRKTAIIYTYDGLYSVEKYWQVKGDHGCSVFKFELRRVPGQPELAVKVVKKLAAREGVCVLDICQGKEKLPICAVNTIDEEHPLHFKYITKMMNPSWYNPTPPRGCDCTNRCSDSKKCVCVIKNGGVIPFNRNGAIIEAMPLVYECGPSCGCPPSCYNRVSQHGIKFQLEIFKTESRGWGVRSLTSISSGSFICEYAGELLRDREAEQRTSSDEYLFDIGHDYDDYSHLDDPSNLTSPALQSNVSDEVADDGEYTIDAAEYGNVGRFINHSCSPNLYAQNVLYDHDDKRVPHIMLFAAENIPPLQELTYHYNYKIDQVHDSDGYIKQKKCYCGSSDCSGRLY